MEATEKPEESRKGVSNGNSKRCTLVTVPLKSLPVRKNVLLSPSAPEVDGSVGREESNGASRPASLEASQHLDSSASATNEPAIQWEYDVYAKPFVPSALRAVNLEPAPYVVTTTAKHQININRYVESFAGKEFIPERVHVPWPNPGLQRLSGHLKMNASTYLEYFVALWKIEIEAKREENETYTLYKVDLMPLPPTDDDRLYALSIPGLREDSPLVELGDTIQLRQLHVDSYGNLLWLTVMVPPEGSSNPSDYKVPRVLNWTGVQYNASVYGISRAQETVYLKISGLNGLFGFGVRGIVCFNAVLPLKERLLGAQWTALGIISRELLKGDVHEELCRQTAEIAVAATSQGKSEETARSNGTSQSIPAATNGWIRRMLFPTDSDGKIQTKLRTINFRRGLFDHKLNYEQLQAVNSVCADEYGTLPFLISGPPGTGKTKTLVELALQLLNTTKVAHILICAPSEAAADTLAQRLRIHLSPTQLLRLNGPGRQDIEVPRELTPYCYMENNMYYLPPFKQFMKYNIVVTSARDAGLLSESRLTNADLYNIEQNTMAAFQPESNHVPTSLHWGALLMDEAAQATELDALLPLSIVMPPSAYPQDLPQPRLVMAGDQNQLGPRTASRDERFSKSLFARLFERGVYSKHPMARDNSRPSVGAAVMTAAMLPILYPPFVNLIRNYRSHPAILSEPSTLFYNDTLIPEIPIPQTPLQASGIWQGRRWPVLYIPHTGLDDIERDGGGWYNYSEARIACDLAQRLIIESGVQQKDICIMSPFAAQVRVLRNTIRNTPYGGGSGLWDVNIGPLEAFQGLESRVVIICTTRTRDRFLEADTQRGLGLIGQKRKMNVAITRAKEALVVIGSPNVLSKDEHWNEFLAFCDRNGLVEPGSKEALTWTAAPGKVALDSWEAVKPGFAGSKVGVLEKALLVKEEKEKEQLVENQRRILGGGHAAVGLVGEDGMWEAGLRAALEDWAIEEEGVDGEELYTEDEEQEDESEDEHEDEETSSEDTEEEG
ncbi:P-loop containing nucleoside triphosphate hydrolase protein [Lophiotrema nucula]|uniref:P-loop containing nucleoside triphosphate hydrolase protein n=1 Tax=Lophiotrema nucula TaxID=690887 RepID=A0A6A5Z9R5_9PLEO|nr:P-loop containing nucleoside triphosphate hydrolase protein [Lophiotrema nucula]